MSIRNLAVVLGLALLLFDQSPGQDTRGVKAVQQAYDQFDYTQTVLAAQRVLQRRDSIPKNDLVILLTLKGVAEYSLGREDSARITFSSLLAADPATTLDPVAYSPKIIEFFDEVRRRFVDASKQISGPDQDSVAAQQNRFTENLPVPQASIVKSLVLPGWGQLSSNDAGSRTKGWLFGSAAVATLASSVYYVIRTNTLQDDYLSARERPAIATAYDEYNSAYLKRNISLIAFAAVWTAAQIDLIYFSPAPNGVQSGLSFTPEIDPSAPNPTPVFTARYTF